jgi:hypothetical protein
MTALFWFWLAALIAYLFSRLYRAWHLVRIITHTPDE